ncbi:MAG: hypothetical protein MOB07_27110 [Acidobacteria bacterium]|nr:hypothetical protein [Acidobacteriota bacterium]
MSTTEPWGLSLRIPEIPAAVLGKSSLFSLVNGYVDVFAGIQRVNRINALDLKPGVGNAQVEVPPTSDDYVLRPEGAWPQGVELQRWRAKSRGLNSNGTLFRLHHGEWVRLRERSAVEWGETLFMVAQRQFRPPMTCQPKPLRHNLGNEIKWAAWQLELPDTPAKEIEDWLDRLGYIAILPSGRIQLVSPSLEGARDEVPKFKVRLPFVIAVSMPNPAPHPVLKLSDHVNMHQFPIKSSRDHLITYIAVTATHRGQYTIFLNDEPDRPIRFEAAEQSPMADPGQLQLDLPRLQVQVGDTTFPAWSHAKKIVLPSSTFVMPQIDVGFGQLTIDLPITVSWESRTHNGHSKGLSRRGAARAISDLLTRRESLKITVDAGALGRVELHFLTPDTGEECSPSDRVTRWLTGALTNSRRIEAHCLTSPWVHRMSSQLMKKRAKLTVTGVSKPLGTILRASARRHANRRRTKG